MTKIKEQLEIFLSSSNNLIRNSERIDKGIKILKNEKEEKNKIKEFSYISKINKNQNEINTIISKFEIFKYFF